ncbi:MAG: hypothetical protein HDS64_00940, partial [Bacteroidales bacterium]|nr:hypothetical protein [Bacteroidales bacterium]
MRVSLIDIQPFTSHSVVIFGYFDVAVGHRQLTNFLCVKISNETQNRNYMESTAITFDQLPHVVGGLSEKLDRVLELLEKVGIANPFNHHKPKRRIVYAKEACTIIGKSLSSLYRGIKAPYDPIPSYKRGKL